MIERAYTVAEIDALRRVVEDKWLYGTYSWTPAEAARGRMSRVCYMPEEKEKAVEERVRTHMLAGHTAEDLIQSERIGA